MPRTIEEIAEIVIVARDGVPIRIKDVAEVGVGHVIRRGGVTANGKGEVVLGLAFMRMGENSRDGHDGPRPGDEGRAGRPCRPASTITVVYERTDLVDHVLQTVERNLFEGAILVIAVLFAFLGNLRAGLIVASAIPLSMLFAVTMMQKVGIAGSLMSLGAIDFGLVVDSSVVMVENCVRHLAHDRTDRPKLDIIRDAAVEVRKPTMFGELIIMIVYLPILTLQGVEGKLFRPMALTVVFALLGSMVLSLTLMPVLASLGLPRRTPDKETFVDRIAHRLFQPLLRLGMAFPRCDARSSSGSVTVATTILGLTPRLGVRPAAQRGDDRHQHRSAWPSVSLEESLAYGTRIEALLKEEFPDEIDQIWSRTGTAEVATDPMGFEVTDVYITLKPRSRWKQGKTQEDLVVAMAEVTEQLPGMRAVYSQPIEMRINEMVAGIRADLGIKLFGEDLDVLKDEGRRDRAGGAGRSPARRMFRPSRSPGCRCFGSRSTARRCRATACPPARCSTRSPRRAGSRSARSWSRTAASRWSSACPPRYRDDPRCAGEDPDPHGDGPAIAADPAGAPVETTGPSTIQREWGAASDHRAGEHPGPRHGLVRREAQERIAREVLTTADRLLDRVGRSVREHDPRRATAVDRGPAGAGADPEPAVPDVPLGPRRPDDLQRRAVRAGRRRARDLWTMGMPFTISAGVGFVALAGASMLEGLVLVSAIRDRMAHGIPKRRGDRAGPAGPAPPGLDDGHGRRAGVRADDALDRHRRRGPAPAGDRRLLRHGF